MVRILFSLSRNSRKTECGAKQLLVSLSACAAPFALLASATLLAAESYPSWWNYASPDATAVVGIQWENVRQSEFADAVTGELFGSGSLGLPELRLIQEARQVLISGPDLLVAAAGAFPAIAIRTQAVREKFKPATYREVELWISPVQTTLSVARLSDAILLMGTRKTLEAAIDRSLLESGRRYCPLLARAARIAPGRDVWIVAAELPDPLASRFVPLDTAAVNFEGAVAIGDGIALDATFQAGSTPAANAFAEQFRKSIPELPAVAQSLEVTADAGAVRLALHVSQNQMTANLSQGAQRQSAAPQAEPHRAGDDRPVAAPVAEELAAEPARAAKEVASAPAEKPIEKPAGPQVIRIFGLDEGVREIVLPPLQ